MATEPKNFIDKRPNKLFFKHLLRKVFLEDWVTKLVALAVTFALWLGVTGLSTPTTRRFNAVPLTYVISNETEITNSPLQEIDIVVSGDKRKVDQIAKSDVMVQLDLSDVSPGQKVIILSPENVKVTLPLGVKLDEIQPGRIAVNLEPVEEKELPVVAETEGTAGIDHEVYSATPQPSRVRVRGTQSALRDLDHVSTAKVDVEGRETDFIARQIPVSADDPKRVSVLNTVVDVAVRIGEKRQTREFIVPIENETARGKHIAVELYGPKSVLATIDAASIKVEMQKDENGIERAVITLPESIRPLVEIRKPKPAP